MAKRKPYVRISSEVNIQVTAGLQCEDVSNPNANIPDRLKVNPHWTKFVCAIRKGNNIYPSEIIDWPSVQALNAAKVITILEETDEIDERAKTQKNKIAVAVENLERRGIVAPLAKDKPKVKLADIAGDEQ